MAMRRALVTLILVALTAAVPAAWSSPACDTPSAAEIAGLHVHRPLNMWTAEFSNGVVAHVRNDPSIGGRVRVAINLGAGRLAEPAEASGVTDALAAALASPVFVGVTAGERDTLLKPVGGEPTVIEAIGADDGLLLLIDSSTPFVTHAMRIAHELLTDADISETRLAEHNASLALETSFGESYQRGLRDVMGLPGASLEPVSAEVVRAHLACLRATAPIEIAIVMGATQQQGIDAARLAVAAIPPRPYPSRHTWSHAVNVDLPDLPVALRRTHSAPQRLAAVMRGVIAQHPADQHQRDTIHFLRSLYLLGTIVDARLAGVPGVDSASTRVNFVTPYDRAIMLSTVVVCEPAEAERIGIAIETAMRSLAADGPSAEELVAASERFTARRAEARTEPWFWPIVLAKSRWHGISLDAFAEGSEAYERLTVADIQRAAEISLTQRNGIALDLVPAREASRRQ